MNGDVYQKTLRLVECSMFAALGGLTYILSSSLATHVMLVHLFISTCLVAYLEC